VKVSSAVCRSSADRVRHPCVGVSLGLALALLIPSTAAAQRDAFFSALLPLYRTLDGVYGDEGPLITGRLGVMASALARWDEEIREAERQLRPKLTGADPQTAQQIHTVLASLYMERGRFADALREFDADIRLNPTRAPFHRFRGLILQAMSRPAEAADAFRTTWRLEPGDPSNAYRLIAFRSSETTQQEIERALETLAGVETELVRKARPAAQTPFININGIVDDAGAMAFAPAAYASGVSFVVRGELDAGLAALLAAAAADPLVSDPVLRSEAATRGIEALRQGLIPAATTQLETVAAGARESSEGRRILATAQWLAGDVEKGLQNLREAVRLNPSDERSWLALARTLDEIGRPAEADEVLRRAVAAVPGAGALRWELAAASGRRQRTEEADLAAIGTVDRYVLLVGRGELYGALARLARTHLDYERGIGLLEQAAAVIPNNAAAHKALGRAYLEDGRDLQGYAELVVALMLDPEDVETLTEIGRLHLTAGRSARALEALERAVASDAGNQQAVYALGRALANAGRTAEGQKRLEEAEQLQARDVETERRQRTAAVLQLEAEVRMSERDYEGAVGFWKQLVALERSAGRHLRLADALIALKRMEQAAVELQAAIALNAGPDAHRRLAEVLQAIGRNEESARERSTYVQRRLEEMRQRAGLGVPGQ
jgi:tetratricopeptide (TPR) repeat protein